MDRRATFQDLRRARRRRAGAITVSWVSGDPDEPRRVGFAIGRHVGSAVERNRLRRRLRTLMREVAPRLPPGAYLIGTSPSATQLSHDELRDNLMRALEMSWPR